MDRFPLTSSGGLAWLECARLAALPWLLHAFSTRRGGSSQPPATGLNLGFTEYDDPHRVEDNRRRFLHELGAERFRLATVRQVHSSTIYRLAPPEAAGQDELRYVPAQPALEAREALRVTNPPPAADGEPERRVESGPFGDAMMTAETGILLAVRAADCLPILLVAPRERVVAAVHAGWRGALQRIAQKTAEEMKQHFGAAVAGITAAIGPGIGAECYAVGEEIAQTFRKAFGKCDRFFRISPTGSLRAPSPAGSNQRIYLDLVAVVRQQLREAGLAPRNIHAANLCTDCQSDLFFSYRKEGPKTGRMMAVIGIRP